MIVEGIAEACQLRELQEPARSGDRAAALKLRNVSKRLSRILVQPSLIHQVDAWLADHDLPTDAASELIAAGLPLLSLELGRRRAARAARPLAPSIDSVIEAAEAADAAMLRALKDAKTICRNVVNKVHLEAIPPIGTVVRVGRRKLTLVQVTPAGRLIWHDRRFDQWFTSGLTGTVRKTGRPA